MMPYLEFHGSSDEDVVSFLENLELTCISNHIQDVVQVLRVLKICLKGDARTWLKKYESGLGDDVLNVEEVKTALTYRFVKVEDPEKVWHDMQGLMQGDREVVETYVKKFLLLWESLCRSLLEGQVPPRCDEERQVYDRS